MNASKLIRAALAVAAGKAVMQTVPGGVPDADVSVRLMSVSDTRIRCALFARSRQFEDKGQVRHELARRIHAALRVAGIEMATLRAPLQKNS